MAATTSSNNTTIDRSNPVFFWKPDQEHGYLGQWYASPFVSVSEDGSKVEYRNCEQYMMHQKGVLFAPDHPITAQILTAELDPENIKKLGRQIPDFDDNKWKKHRYQIVVDANYFKFTQNEDLKTQLLETGNRELVEASPRDKIWGVGFGAANAPKRRERWGLNLLGKALMDVRERIRQEEAGAKEAREAQ
ncbi:hypothetical protein DRE_00007 [Drechslerella stenobrocha 248]|uniref:NADAR domain-containing protein n=1 Tax=Drechslerella stenobrocha 248 TaxID=1043628 RepID=W7I9F0_9PEZI|nr:hypothetical protein DRE_00007 [Drechslerella stenobrocha 248]